MSKVNRYLVKDFVHPCTKSKLGQRDGYLTVAVLVTYATRPSASSHKLSSDSTVLKDFFCRCYTGFGPSVLRHCALKKISTYHGILAFAFGSPWLASTVYKIEMPQDVLYLKQVPEKCTKEISAFIFSLR